MIPRTKLSAALAGALLVGTALTACSSSTSAASPTDASTADAAETSTSPSPTPSLTPKTTPSRKAPKYDVPVVAHTTFGRAHHDYPATDMFAACGSKVVAPTDGTIQDVTRKDIWTAKTNKGADRGGLSWSLVGTDGVRYYGSHLRELDAKIVPGAVVHRGQTIGQVGHSGDAAGIACHLHFGISPACGPGDWWTRRGEVSPYRFLKAWQSGENLSPAKAVATWKQQHGCPTSANGAPDS